MRIITLIENTPGAPGCAHEHGLSLYIETARHTLLERRLRAMYLSRALICRELSGADGRER